ncbi:polyprenyl synthetase family protein [Wenxinia marina]|uniref:Geranylgeranyl diphosphate synthase n=1 Tax=Wenxinia marina DSM 24838 TaxID=1123501 RepID=A0A0D0Q9M3_9RHOB|nr:farnesyl diphosphate synthase [Wenxinia marina]KIQ71134.1 Geranylgeranyl pyrophosphate synthase [Wenxinia marina DSM 24838]GGL54577.1 farnesyl-diphosphate synthase [Wenxinia marina]
MAEGPGAADARVISDRLAAALPEESGDIGELVRAMRYAVEGGKRLRGLIVLESARIHGVPAAAALDAAAAIEAMHAYSLVHDDLPAMDDDALRRGRPTVHVAFGEAMAILVGDALQSLAFDLVAGIDGVPAERVVDLARRLARQSGMAGMAGGQWCDIAAERGGRPADPMAHISHIQRLKTGALFRWSAEAGAMLAGADPAPMTAYADALGLAFQIRDDLLDVDGDAAAVGKAVGKDAGRGKATFVELMGADGARARAAALADEAVAALAGFGPEADPLRDLARFAVARVT